MTANLKTGLTSAMKAVAKPVLDAREKRYPDEKFPLYKQALMSAHDYLRMCHLPTVHKDPQTDLRAAMGAAAVFNDVTCMSEAEEKLGETLAAVLNNDAAGRPRARDTRAFYTALLGCTAVMGALNRP
jgi:hypothetical protein